MVLGVLLLTNWRYVNFYNKINSYGAEFNIAKGGITNVSRKVC